MSPPPAGAPGPEITPGHPAFDHVRTSAGDAVLWPLSLRGALDAALLRRALSTVLERREVSAGEEGVEMETVDLRQTTREEGEAELRKLAARELERPFPPRSPLLRALLLRMDQDAHLLLVTLHHVISDGWSVRVLRDELATVYGEILRGGDGGGS